MAQRAVSTRTRRSSLWTRFGRLAQRPWPGAPIALLLIALAYLWVGVFGAEILVDRLSTPLFASWLMPLASHYLGLIPSPVVRDALLDPTFGILQNGLFAALGVVLPVLFCFYSLQALFEDSGYLARLAVLSDRLMSKVGLNGQALVPLVLGFSCATMSIVGARTLPTKKERTILTLLVVGVPCAPLLAAMAVVLAGLPWTSSAVVFGLVLVRLLVAGHVAGKVLPGHRSDFILELPEMRMPRLTVLGLKTARRTWQFVKEALPIFIAASLLVFVLERLGGLALITEWSRPVVEGVLGLPEGAMAVFIKTAVRRESGAAELSALRGSFAPLQLVVMLVMMMFLVPCANATVAVFKERGLRTGLALLGLTALSGLVAGALVNLVGHSFV